jgi:hypothetical protein
MIDLEPTCRPVGERRQFANRRGVGCAKFTFGLRPAARNGNGGKIAKMAGESGKARAMIAGGSYLLDGAIEGGNNNHVIGIARTCASDGKLKPAVVDEFPTSLLPLCGTS